MQQLETEALYCAVHQVNRPIEQEKILLENEFIMEKFKIECK